MSQIETVSIKGLGVYSIMTISNLPADDQYNYQARVAELLKVLPRMLSISFVTLAKEIGCRRPNLYQVRNQTRALTGHQTALLIALLHRRDKLNVFIEIIETCLETEKSGSSLLQQSLASHLYSRSKKRR